MYNIFYLITPTLGMLRDYSKYKTISPTKFIRTPCMYYIINIAIKGLIKFNIISKFNRLNKFHIIILERWIMLLLKTIKSVYYNDYLHKKEKYKIKYNKKYTNKYDHENTLEIFSSFYSLDSEAQ